MPCIRRRLKSCEPLFFGDKIRLQETDSISFIITAIISALDERINSQVGASVKEAKAIEEQETWRRWDILTNN
jgi:hypothetical protein